MKKNNPARRAGEKNNLAPILSEKNILARTKNQSPPPLNIKWTVPNKKTFLNGCFPSNPAITFACSSVC